ncbi:MAG TPA: DoxX family protein [Gemmatimonadaceae bacterium]
MTTIVPTRVNAAFAIVRVVTGATFIAHGAQKLFVYGVAGVTGAFAQMGIPLPGIAGPLTAVVELLAGLALVIGLLSRLAGLGLAITMIGAIFFAHLSAGFFAPNGIEFPLALLASSVAIAIAGGGDWSLDARLASRRQVAERAGRNASGIRRAA